MTTLSALNGGGEGMVLLLIGGVILLVSVLSSLKAEWIVGAAITVAVCMAGTQSVLGFIAGNRPVMIGGVLVVGAFFYRRRKEPKAQ